MSAKYGLHSPAILLIKITAFSGTTDFAPSRVRWRLAAHLFNDERHRVALVHEAELAPGRVRGGRVHEDAAVLERAVNVGHHRADVAASVRLLFQTDAERRRQ